VLAGYGYKETCWHFVLLWKTASSDEYLTTFLLVFVMYLCTVHHYMGVVDIVKDSPNIY
jgi:hypothetical protein